METFSACTDSGLEGSAAVDSDQLRGILMSLGGCLGFIGTVSTYFPFSVLGVVSFGLVVAFGALVFQKRREARLLAGATLWFAPLGGIACVLLIWFTPLGSSASTLWRVQGSVGLFGMCLALAGAIGGHRVDPNGRGT
jgi:hypothetical protein